MTRRLILLALLPLILFGLAWTALWYVLSLIRNPARGWRIAILVDEAGNVDANGQVNTTISARAARAQLAGRRWGCMLCKLLAQFQPDHCTKALSEPGGG